MGDMMFRRGKSRDRQKASKPKVGKFGQSILWGEQLCGNIFHKMILTAVIRSNTLKCSIDY